MEMICASCGETTGDADSCDSCGADALLRERYRLEEVLGEGASGTTYVATDTEYGRRVAVKELGLHGMDSFKAHELFEREAGVLCRLDHPGVPRFHDYFEWGEGKALRFYLVMEFIEGTTLLEELDERQYTPQAVWSVIRRLAEIAQYLHGLAPPVIHRDIKPSNVMRRADGTLVLIDFGSVRDALEPEDTGSTVAGTVGYMAPEQLRGAASPASDVYGIGATAVHLLTRREPTELMGSTNRLEWERHLEVAPEFARLLRLMLAVDPEDRLDDGEVLVEAIERTAEDAPLRKPAAGDDNGEIIVDDSITATNQPGGPADTGSGGDQSRRRQRRSRIRAILICIFALVTVLVCGLGAMLFVLVETPDGDIAGEEIAEQPTASPPGELTRSDVMDVMSAHRDDFRDCGEHDDFEDQVMVEFNVATDGGVDESRLQTEEGPSSVRDCLLEVVDELEFPEIDESQTVVYPLLLR